MLGVIFFGGGGGGGGGGGYVFVLFCVVSGILKGYFCFICCFLFVFVVGFFVRGGGRVCSNCY